MHVIWRILIAFMGLSISAYSFNFKTVNLGERVILPCEQECVTNVKWAKITPERRVVVQCSNRNCDFENGGENRISVSPEKKPLLIFTAAVYTDMGSYECQCDGKPICDVRLTVLVSIRISAAVLDRVILPCYWNTMKDKADFHWDMKDKTVLHFQDGKLMVGKGFEEKFSYAEKGYWEGNLSLIINQVNSSDEGLYRCYVNGQGDKGYPHSYILTVEYPKDVPYNQNIYFYTTVILFGFMLIGMVILLLCAQRKKKKCETTELKSVCVSSDKDLSPECIPLNSRETNPRSSKLKRRRSKRRPKTWSGSIPMPSSNPQGNDDMEAEDLLR